MIIKGLRPVLSCDRCGMTATSDTRRASKLRERARKRGWECAFFEDWCPFCLDDRLTQDDDIDPCDWCGTDLQKHINWDGKAPICALCALGAGTPQPRHTLTTEWLPA